MSGDEIERRPERPEVVADGLLERMRMTNDLIKRAGMAFEAAEQAMQAGQARDAKDYSLTGAILLDKARQLAGDPEPRRDASSMSSDEQTARLTELLDRARRRGGGGATEAT